MTRQGRTGRRCRACRRPRSAAIGRTSSPRMSTKASARSNSKTPSVLSRKSSLARVVAEMALARVGRPSSQTTWSSMWPPRSKEDPPWWRLMPSRVLMLAPGGSARTGMLVDPGAEAGELAQQAGARPGAYLLEAGLVAEHVAHLDEQATVARLGDQRLEARPIVAARLVVPEMLASVDGGVRHRQALAVQALDRHGGDRRIAQQRRPTRTSGCRRSGPGAARRRALGVRLPEAGELDVGLCSIETALPAVVEPDCAMRAASSILSVSRQSPVVGGAGRFWPQGGRRSRPRSRAGG